MSNAIDSLFRGARAAATGLSAERVRLDVIAENIAGARVTRTPEGGPYARKVVLFEPLLRRQADGTSIADGVRAARIERDARTPFPTVLDPSHPDANERGEVLLPNVDSLAEMADLITALRAYEANLSVQEGFFRMAQRALELAR